MEYWVSFKYMHVLSILGDIPSSPHALEVSSILTDQEYSNPDHLHMYSRLGKSYFGGPGSCSHIYMFRQV